MASEDDFRNLAADLALEQFCTTHRTDWLGYAASHARGWDEAEDAVQYAVMRLYEHHGEHGRLPGDGNPVAWVKTVISHYIIDRNRRARVAERNSQALLPVSADFSDEIDDQILAKAAMKFIMSLDPKSHEIAMMRYAEGLTPKEIAEKLGMNQVTVRAILHRIRKKICSHMGIDFRPRRDSKERTI